MRLDKVLEPLSPPTSPRMSGSGPERSDPFWLTSELQTTPFTHGDYKPPADPAYLSHQYREADRFGHESTTQMMATPRHSDFALERQASQPGLSSSHDAGSNTRDQQHSSYRQHSGASSHTTTGSQLNRSPTDTEGHDVLDDDDVDDSGDDSDGEDEGPSEGRSKTHTTPLELRNKRKMKRFRLTHNQTRFLMSEFARQAHPDAAHRDRLSQQIPGLSPRQVQVWFQNRRAKLKRSTVDDRETMMRSRALPQDLHQGLPMHAPFGSSSGGAPVVPAFSSPTDLLRRPADTRPHGLDTLHRPHMEHNYLGASGITPTLGSMAFTPPGSTKDTTSPITSSGEMPSASFSQRAAMESPRGSYYPMPSSSASHNTGHYFNRPPVTMSDRYRRPSGDVTASPLRTSMSYPNTYGSGSSSINEDRRHSGPGGEVLQQGSHQHVMPPPTGPVGLGFTYDSLPNFSQLSQSRAPTHQHPSVTSSQQPPYSASTGQMSSQQQYQQYYDYQNQQTAFSPHQYHHGFSGPSFPAAIGSDPYATSSAAAGHSGASPSAGQSGQAHQQHRYVQTSAGAMASAAGKEQGRDEDQGSGSVPISAPY